jgi:uncharacterized protein YbjT (DUF2867 family)
VGSPLPPFDWHGQIEVYLRESGIPSVTIQSCFFMTNLLAAAEPVRVSGKLFAPAGAGRDDRSSDTTAVAAIVLTSRGRA